MSESTYVLNQENTAWRVIDGEVVVINAETTFYFSLNRSASVVWHQLLEGASVDSATRALASHYARDESEVRPQVSLFLNQLVKQELIVAQPAEEVPPGADLRSTPGDDDDDAPYEHPIFIKHDTIDNLIVSGE